MDFNHVVEMVGQLGLDAPLEDFVDQYETLEKWLLDNDEPTPTAPNKCYDIF